MASASPLEGAADVILHVKVTDEEKRLVFPATRYANVINRPVVVNDASRLYGAPFGFYATDTEYLTRNEIRSLIGPIV